MGNFKFNGTSSEDLGLVIQTPPTYSYPERDAETIHVPGRNGDLIIDKNNFKNVKRSYLIGKGYATGNHYSNSQAILKWLESANGKYVRLEDSYDDQVFRLASYRNGGSFTNIYDEAGSATIEFDCKPQRFLLIGENEIENVYSTEGIIIDNVSPYEAYPLTVIKNIPQTQGHTTMITLKDENDGLLSSITINDIKDDELLDISIDSEDQTVVDGEGNDIAIRTSLNGKKFPVLVGNFTKILIEKFTNNNTGLDQPISSYKSIIQNRVIDRKYKSGEDNDKYSYVKSEYSEKATLIEKKQIKVTFDSLENLISKKMKVFNLQSMQSLALDTAETYEFDSINSILEALSSKWDSGFGPVKSDDSDYNWISVVESDDHLTLTIKPTSLGGYFSTSENKQWTKLTSSDTIKTLTRETVDSEWESFSVSYIKQNSSGGFDTSSIYQDRPSWLDVGVKYDNDSTKKKVVGFDFKVNANGYFFVPATGINILGLQLGSKAGWAYRTTGYLLDSLTWNSQKKAFVSKKGLTTKTDSTFSYSYKDSVPQYTDTADLVKFEDDNNKTLSKIKITAKKAGFYMFYEGDQLTTGLTHWIHVPVDGTITSNLSGLSKFNIHYIEEDSALAVDMRFDLTDEAAEYFDSRPYYETNGTYVAVTNADGLNAGKIFVKVLKQGNYRYTYINEEKKEETYSEFVNLNTNDIVVTSSGRDPRDQSYSVCYIDKIPADLSDVHDRAFYGNFKQEPDISSKIELTSKPDWLDIEYTEDFVIYKIKKSTEQFNSQGLYQCDSQTVWTLVKNEDIPDDGYVILKTASKDDAQIRRIGINDLSDLINELPQYTNDEKKQPLWFNIIPTIDNNFNPDGIKIIAVDPGYYKANNESNWTYYNEGDVIATSAIDESNVIHHLINDNIDLSDVVVTVTPRWWML